MDRLGLPNLKGQRLLVGSTVVDSLAAGLVFAFLIVYFQRVTDLGLVEIGGALTIGRLAAMPTPPLVGILIDRFGSRRIVMAGNVVSFLGLVVCAFATSSPEIAVGQFLSQLGITAYWTANRGVIELAAAGTDRRRWYALLGALRNLGTGFGTAVTALFVSFGDEFVLRVVVAVSGGAFLVAAVLLGRWQPPSHRPSEVPRKEHDTESEPDDGEHDSGLRRTGFLTVLRDRDYALLLGINLSFVLAVMVLPLVVTVYTTETIGAPAWFAGALVVLNTLMVALLNNPVAGYAERFDPAKVIAVAAGVVMAGYVAFALAGSIGSAAPAAVILLIAIVVYTFSEIISTPPINDLSVTLSDPDIAGRYQGAFQLSWNVGMAVSPVLFTAFLSVGPVYLWIMLGACSLAASFGAVALSRRTGYRRRVAAANAAEEIQVGRERTGENSQP